MNAAWIALWLLAGAWLAALDAFKPFQRPNPWWMIAAVVVGVWALRRETPVPRRGWALVGGLTALLAALILPAPFRDGFALVAAGAALHLIAAGRWRAVERVAMALAGLGIVWALQAALVPFFYHLAARYHDVGALTPLIYVLLEPFFHPMALSGGDLFIPRAAHVYQCATTWERLGLLPAMLIGAGGVAALLFARAGARRVLWFLLGLALYLPVRYAVMVGIEVSTASAVHYWDTLYLALSFLPFALIAQVAFPLAPEAGAEAAPSATARPRSPRAAAATALYALAGAALLVAGVAYHDPGARKQGRVLIDELHSDWEWTTEAFDTRWYGQRAGYNYYSMGQFLRYYYDVETLREPITPERLARCDVLFIKTPTSPFAPEEIDAIERFVRGGGGLLLIGDHTNVFGTSTYLNAIARRFGMRFRYDSTYDLASMALSLYRPPAVFRHPVVLHLPPYLFATSCSLTLPFFSEGSILGYGLKSMDADYSQVSYFPEDKASTHYRFGVFVQAGGVRCGRGRVLGYTDSTCFSNFFMFVPGKPELILGMLDWVNRSNRRRGVNGLLLVLGAVLLALALRRGGRAGLSGALALAVGATWGFLAATGACAALDRRGYPEPAPHSKVPVVAFEWEHSRFDLPIFSLTPVAERSLLTFYVWTQRLDLVPKLLPTLAEALHAGGPVVLVNPGRSFTLAELDSITYFVRQGGRLLVLDDPRNVESSTDQVLGVFNMRRDTVVVGPTPIRDRSGAIVGSSRWAGGVKGGEPLLFVKDSVAVAAEQTLERGRVTVFMNSFAFSDQVMGATGVSPDPIQQQIYALEFWLLRRLTAPDPDAVRLAAIAPPPAARGRR